MTKLALRRTLGAVLVSGAALALTTAAATSAEAATVVKVRAVAISGGNAMSVTGTTGNDVLGFTATGSTVEVTSNNTLTVPDGSCTFVSSTKARCSGVVLLQVLTGSGNDEIRNDTGIKMGSNGGPDNDTLVGGSNRDTLNGGSGFDTADGRGGIDTCGGDEVRTSCEEVTS